MPNQQAAVWKAPPKEPNTQPLCRAPRPTHRVGNNGQRHDARCASYGRETHPQPSKRPVCRRSSILAKDATCLWDAAVKACSRKAPPTEILRAVLQAPLLPPSVAVASAPARLCTTEMAPVPPQLHAALPRALPRCRTAFAGARALPCGRQPLPWPPSSHAQRRCLLDCRAPQPWMG